MRYIDNVKFAKSGKEIKGKLNLLGCERVQEIDKFTGEISYELIGCLDGLNRPTLKLSIHGIIGTLCQNCLQDMELELNNQSRITVFFNEDQLDAALFAEGDTDVEDGVLAEAEFDIMQLLEDEVIMLLPYASKHESCIGMSYHDSADNPFDILKNII